MATMTSTAARERADTAWTGWIAFAGVLMMIVGILNAFQGLVALIEDEYYVVAQERVLVFDFTTWGVVLMIWGGLLFIAGLALMSGSGWARWFTIVVASLNILAQLAFASPEYPLWALIIVGINILVLYALIVRWGDVQPTLKAAQQEMR
jgi:hypothetical protein